MGTLATEVTEITETGSAEYPEPVTRNLPSSVPSVCSVAVPVALP